MNKFAIIINGTQTVLRYRVQNGQYILTTDASCPLYILDKTYLLERIIQSNGDGSYYLPHFDSILKGRSLSIVKVETEVVISEIKPLNLQQKAS